MLRESKKNMVEGVDREHDRGDPKKMQRGLIENMAEGILRKHGGRGLIENMTEGILKKFRGGS